MILEYDHFAKDCSNVAVTEENQTEHMHHMPHSEEP